jgi:hypothetical protein
MRGHNKYFLQDNKLYHLTTTGCIGEEDAQEKGAGYKGDFYVPYNDANYKCRTYPARLVYDVLTNPENGAGATLDEDALVTRGNEHYGEMSSVSPVFSEPSVVSIRYYVPAGARVSRLQKGVNVIEYLMSDGTTRTAKVIKH